MPLLPAAAMPATQPLDLSRDPHQINLPIPPPPVLPRDSFNSNSNNNSNNNNMSYNDAPSTPRGKSSYHDFVTPQQTPQGSPSKSHPPPGAFDLPNAFDNAMKLFPSASGPTPALPPSPTKQLPPSRLPQLSPTKATYGAYEATAGPGAQQKPPGSPTRNKENTPPSAIPRSPKKESAFVTQAAQSRLEGYRTRDAADQLAPPRPTYVQRGLSAEDLEKLQKTSVKRLANVTQLCKDL